VAAVPFVPQEKRDHDEDADKAGESEDERRFDDGDGPFTHDEFVDNYGEAGGDAMWEAAVPRSVNACPPSHCK
jgi:hypothetical protein